VGQGDVSADAVTVVHGDFEVFARSPGIEADLVYLHAAAVGLSTRPAIPRGVSVMEILLEEPTARVERRGSGRSIRSRSKGERFVDISRRMYRSEA